MITVTVQDFRGCRDARLECAPIALVCGLNAAGKSSLAMGVGCTLSGNMQPVGRAVSLVAAGATTATVELQGENGVARGRWPDGNITHEGDPPQASEYAAGLLSIVTMAAKDRARTLSALLHAEPTRDDIAAAFVDLDVVNSDQMADSLWKLIEQHGWDGTHQQRRDRGVEMKGAWRQVTGANYGSRIAATWRPDLEGENEDALMARHANAKSRHERAIAAQAVSADEKRRLEEEAELAGPRQDALARITARVEEYAGVHRKAQEARQALPPAGQPTTIPCPYCEMPIAVSKSGPETRFDKVGQQIDDAEVRKRRTSIAEADGRLSHAYDDLNQARRDLASAEAAVRDSLAARDRLASWPRATETGVDIAAAEAELRRAETALADCRKKREADELHAKIVRNEVIIDMVAGDGLRAKKLQRVLATFQEQLDELTSVAKWPRIEIDPNDMGLTLAGRAYPLLSTSEQYRCRVVVQIATAAIDGSSMIVIDGADILDAPSRGGILRMLDHVELPALVTMTQPRSEIVPDLAAAGMGHSYWLAMGVVEPIEQRVPA